ncbi:hypothetical protein ACGC1H_006453 [Rhizoctonia solani]
MDRPLACARSLVLTAGTMSEAVGGGFHHKRSLLCSTLTKSKFGMRSARVGLNQPANKNIDLVENRPDSESKIATVAVTSTQRVIQISELLILIAQKLDAKKQHMLLLVSKHFFRSIGPLVWKRVPGLDIMMRLIKDVKVEFNRSRVRGYSEWYDHCRWTLTLPSNPDLSRYEIYSPWIHELEIFAGYDQEIKNLEPFLTRLDGYSPLPNLQRLTTYTTLSIGGEQLMAFINIFISPSLTEIRTIIPNNGLPRGTDSRVPSSAIPASLRKIK